MSGEVIYRKVLVIYTFYQVYSEGNKVLFYSISNGTECNESRDHRPPVRQTLHTPEGLPMITRTKSDILGKS